MTTAVQTIGDEIGVLRDLIEEDKGQFDGLCRFTPRVSDAIASHSIMRSLVPSAFGGSEAGVLSWFRVGRDISYLDASAGWVASQNAAANCIIATVGDASLASGLMACPNANASTSIRSTVTLRAAGEGEIEIDGTWQFSSGCTLATHVGGMVVPEKGALERAAGVPFVIVESALAEMVPNWDPIGLRGTGSHDVVVRRVTVPRSHVFWVFGGAGGRQWHRYSPIGNSGVLVTLSAAAVQLGVSRRALDLARQTLLTRSQMPAADAPLIDEPTLIHQLAVAEGKWLLANGGMEAAIARLDEELDSGSGKRECRLNARLAGVSTVQICADIARAAFELGGTEASVRGSALEQCFRDASVLPSHIAARSRQFAPTMRLIVGRQQAADEFGA